MDNTTTVAARVNGRAARTPLSGMRPLFLVWKGYQRRSEVLAPLLQSDLLFIKHVFRSKLFRPLDYLFKLIYSIVRITHRRPPYVLIQAPPHYAALPAILMRVPYVIDAHNSMFQSGWRKHPIASYIMRNAKALIVHNREILEWARLQYPSAKTYVISDPLREILPPTYVERNPQQILFVCSFGQDEPVGAIIEVIETLADYRFIITADTRKLSRSYRQRLVRCPNLTLTGYLGTEDYHTVLCTSAAAVALTSNEATQQSGACEALSSDTPLITTRSTLSQTLFGDWATLVENTPSSIILAIRSLGSEPLDLAAYRQSWNENIQADIRRFRNDLHQE